MQRNVSRKQTTPARSVEQAGQTQEPSSPHQSHQSLKGQELRRELLFSEEPLPPVVHPLGSGLLSKDLAGIFLEPEEEQEGGIEGGHELSVVAPQETTTTPEERGELPAQTVDEQQRRQYEQQHTVPLTTQSGETGWQGGQDEEERVPLTPGQFTLDLLKKDVQRWNRCWREYPDQRPNLRGVNLAGMELTGVDLSEATLRGARLSNANLKKANLRGADLAGATLREANLSWSDLSRASLFRANLIHANLREANLTGADLREAVLDDTVLEESILHGILLSRTIFGNVDLSQAKGLETVEHRGPSIIGLETIARSSGRLPVSFLQGAGVQESFLPLINPPGNEPTGKQPAEEGQSPPASINLLVLPTCISYASQDQAFVDRLATDLQEAGIPCSCFSHQEETGLPAYSKLLLVLSKDAVASSWIKSEVEGAFNQEAHQQTQVLFPLRIDDTPLLITQAWTMITSAWTASLHHMRMVSDFTSWQESYEYEEAFSQLLQVLKGEA